MQLRPDLRQPIFNGICVCWFVQVCVYIPMCACHCGSQAANDLLAIRSSSQTQEVHEVVHRADSINTALNKNSTAE